uniref:Uncharacterized protein n=1 Tax=Opuntia streptacantha TaxID=393608 RepID=A0A7C8YKB3_OPUST
MMNDMFWYTLWLLVSFMSIWRSVMAGSLSFFWVCFSCSFSVFGGGLCMIYFYVCISSEQYAGFILWRSHFESFRLVYLGLNAPKKTPTHNFTFEISYDPNILLYRFDNC